MTTEEVAALLSFIDKLNPNLVPLYQRSVRENNINGLVLTQCDLEQLGTCLNMKFGDWQLFRSAILALRHWVDPSTEDKERKSPEKSNLKKSRSEASRKSIHFSETESSRPNLEFPSDIDCTDSDQSYMQQSSSDTQYTRAESGLSGFDTIEEVDEQYSSQESQPKLKRQDSIVEEMIYESEMVNKFMHNFTEISEGEDIEDEDEEDFEEDRVNEAQYLPKSGRTGTLNVQFSLNSYDADTSDNETSTYRYNPRHSETDPLLMNDDEHPSSPYDSTVPILHLPRLSKLPQLGRPASSGGIDVQSEPSIPQALDEEDRKQYEHSPLLEQHKSDSVSSSGFPDFNETAFNRSEGSVNTLAVIDETSGTTTKVIEQFTLQEMNTGTSVPHQTAQTQIQGTSIETTLVTDKNKPKGGKSPAEYV